MSHRTPLAHSETATSGAARTPTPADAGRFLALVADKLAATEEVFRRHFGSDVPFIDRAGEYLTTGGGKRVRPALLLLCARLLGHDGEEEVTYGATVEFIHTATLVHDDVIDHSTLRRGRSTVNRLWGNHLTVLLGDWIYANAMKMALSHGRIEVVDRLCAATVKMVEGELLALRRLGEPSLSVDDYFRIIDRKTAHLFAAACSIPSLIDPARPKAGETLAAYGENLGVCFQLVDDLLDFTAREEELGKPVLSDLKEGKLTLPLILLLPRVEARERRKVEMVLEDRAFDRVSPQDVLDLVDGQGTLEETRELAQSYAEKARRQLEGFPPDTVREALEFAPDFVLNRRF